MAKVEAVFGFFTEKLKSSESFSLQELSDSTGWSLSTVSTYSTKKWDSILNKIEDNSYEVNQNFNSFTLDTFIQHQSQKDEVVKFFYQLLVEKAVSACVSAIEIYNKPDFKYREETFSILMINAWELLLKAKILYENNDDQVSIQLFRNDILQLSKSGNPKTISIGDALKILLKQGVLNEVVVDNIFSLIEIRDGSVHFIHNDLMLSVRVQSIGVATIKNFMTLAMQWFRYDFNKFNFYLMPVSFYHQSDIESFSVNNDSRKNLIEYLNTVEKNHEEDEDPDFSISLTIETKFVKRSTEEAIQFRSTDDLNAPEILISEEDALKSYPLTYHKLVQILKERFTDFKQNPAFNAQMRELKMEGEKFCKIRSLDPQRPNSTHKTFYHSRIVEEFDKFYTRKESPEK